MGHLNPVPRGSCSEKFVFAWAWILTEVWDVQAVEATKAHVEKKHALTYEEIEAEREEVSHLHHSQ